jgi:ABC-type Na+ efflux pump permease subunit
MAHPFATWLSKVSTLGATVFAAAHLPVLAVVAISVTLTLITMLALIGALARSKARRDAANNVLTLLLQFLDRSRTTDATRENRPL